MWREHCIKHIGRCYSKTPHQEIEIENSSEVHNSHTFWKYPKLSSYWKVINKILNTIFKIYIGTSERLLLGQNVFFKQTRDDQYDIVLKYISGTYADKCKKKKKEK